MEKSCVDVILNDLDSNPQCPHGPTILFRRNINGGEQKFYACSACRDRKDCAFYWRYGDKWTSQKQHTWKVIKSGVLPEIDHAKLQLRLEEINSLPAQDRAFCHTCNMLLLPFETESHNSHEVQHSLSDFILSHPSELIKPWESSKKEAQYFFTSKTTQAILKMLRHAGIRRLLCVGMPRIHEYVRTNHRKDMDSILLDIDHRYHQFFKDNEYGWFNAFNCHWFGGGKGKEATSNFMETGTAEEFAIVTDPPFGGLMEPLALTFQRLDEMHKKIHPQRKKSLSLMWIIPYFMEPTVSAICPSLSMLDYKVDYENHPLFNDGEKGRKYGSPVRIFTNMLPETIKLPKEDGYWFCTPCKRWSSAENRHCLKCDSCTSKNGCTYIHCNKCKRCVKPSWKHCETCNRCCMQDHKCGEFKALLCFACHQPDHKKKDCPLRDHSVEGFSANRQRKQAKKTGKLSNSEAMNGNSFSMVPLVISKKQAGVNLNLKTQSPNSVQDSNRKIRKRGSITQHNNKVPNKKQKRVGKKE